MDRAHAITRLNTEEIAMEVNNVIKKGLDKLLGDHLYRYELLEKTHDAIMNLPSVRNHLNQAPVEIFENKNNDVNSQMIERLLKRIDELTFEVNQLKQTCKKDCTDIKVEEELVVVKLEQKENIKLEIEEDVTSEEEEEEEEESLEEEEEESLEEEEEESLEEEEEAAEAEENICSECDCKVILKEDIVIVEGKKYCGACDPSSTKEEEEEEDDVETEKSESVAEEEEEEEAVASLEEEEEASANEIVAAEAVASLEEEEEELIEIDIDDVTYCTNNEENGFIYELTEDGDVGDKVGYLKDGEPFFYADEK
jgi:hypothetical protein